MSINNTPPSAFPSKLLRALKSFGKFLAALVLVWVAMFGIYLAWMTWEVKHLRAFCHEVPVGAPMASLRPLAEKYGINPRWVVEGIEETGQENRTVFVPAASTMGEVACAIHFGDHGVLSATIEP